MSETAPYLLHTDAVTRPPKWPRPHYMLENFADVAQMGFPDVCDGQTALGDHQIATHEESAIAYQNYGPSLAKHAEKQQPLAGQLAHELAIKAAQTHLQPQEHVHLAFGFEGTQAPVQEVALSQLRSSPQITGAVLGLARDLGYLDFTTRRAISGVGEERTAEAQIYYKGKVHTGTARGNRQHSIALVALFTAFADLKGLDPEAIPPYTRTLLLPAKALGEYIHEQGGPPYTTKGMAQGLARTLIRDRYQADFADKLFYPDPVSALHRLYAKKELIWQQRPTSYGVQSTRLQVARRGDNGVDCYDIKAHGPTADVAQRAAARIVLAHVGATDPALLQR